MPSVKKLIEKMRQQPNGIRPEEIDKETGDLITIKQESPLKRAYVADVLNRIGA